MLTLSSLSYQWPGSKPQTVDLDMFSGQIVLISGPSGIGKTTLFDIMIYKTGCCFPENRRKCLLDHFMRNNIA